MTNSISVWDRELKAQLMMIIMMMREEGRASCYGLLLVKPLCVLLWALCCWLEPNMRSMGLAKEMLPVCLPWFSPTGGPFANQTFLDLWTFSGGRFYDLRPSWSTYKSYGVWDFVEGRFIRRLIAWKRPYISERGGSLSSEVPFSGLPGYFMSLFRIPKVVC